MFLTQSSSTEYDICNVMGCSTCSQGLEVSVLALALHPFHMSGPHGSHKHEWFCLLS